ncbi:MAG: LysM peptidoglycan-binding domain-containing protein [Acidobacteriota bacterium]
MHFFRKKTLLFLILILLSTIACTHINKNIVMSSSSELVSPGKANPPSDSDNNGKLAESPVDVEIDGVIALAESHYRNGVDNFGKGMISEARKSFDMAVETFLFSSYSINDHPGLEEAYVEMVEKISEFENSTFRAFLSREDYEPLLDELGEVETVISPEEALKERELVGSVVQSLGMQDIIILNNQVFAFIEYFSKKIKDRLQAGIKRSGAYIDMMKRIFREEGIPENLVYMAHVESSFKTYAYSRAKARGIWQFIASTGRKYGLRIDWWIDERCDPEKSTRAAAAYLKDLYAMFGDWSLAMAAYNAGEGKIQRAMARTNSVDFYGIARTKHIRTETKNYIPAIHAAILIASEPGKYGFVEDYDDPLQYDRVTVDSPTDLRVIAKCAETTIEEIKRLNPALHRMQTPPGYPEFKVNIPAGKGELFSANFSNVPKKDRILYTRHLVQRGETLSAIARKYGTSVAAIQRVNNMGKRTLINERSYLVIPGSSYVPPDLAAQNVPASIRQEEKARTSEKYPKGERVVYRVRKGDSLFSISRKFNTDVDSLCAWNGISKSKILYPEEKLIVHAGIKAGVSRQAAEPTATRMTTGAAIGPATGAGKDAISLSPTDSATGSKIIYTVRKGDTLYKIANLYKISLDRLCFWNQISQNDKIYPGTKVTIYTE